ncbi:hypothetical protein ACH4VR_29710 [Streptomyces sp. NPDC020883]|uniref:hypothetical protein n=1 Tax=Streptomyces sp. NPDC020883 TaxID=3365099 RepID=UPI0037BC3E34
MRKRHSRPPRFAAVDNGAIDTIPSILAIGLLTRLIRAKDGDDVTVELLASHYSEGERSLEKAMRVLVDGAYVVKFKIQRAKNERVIEDGKEKIKRGGTWYTTFTADSIPFTAEDASQMLADILADANVSAVRVEPERFDPRKQDSGITDTSTRPAPARPTPTNAGAGPTCENTDSDGSSNGQDPANTSPRPTPPNAETGRPRTGSRGALYKEETVSLSDSRTPAPQRRRTQPAGPADAVVNAYAAAAQRPVTDSARRQLRDQAARLIAAGYPVEWLSARAAEMPDNNWVNLEQHAQRSRAPLPGQSKTSAGLSPQVRAAMEARVARGTGL